MKPIENSITRTNLAISLFRKDIAVILSATNTDLEERIEKSQVHLWHIDKWSSMNIQMSCVAVVTWATKVLMSCYLSHDGIVFFNDGSKDILVEPIDGSDDGPSDIVQMKSIKYIENTLIVVGMARLVYKKTLPDGKWIRIDKGLFVPRAERTNAVGLNDVISDGNGALLAVGYKGEIWQMNSNGIWALENSPCNIYLSSIAKQPDKDEFTIVGLNGTIIKGNPKKGWTLLNINTKSDFWSVVYFQNKIFVASDSGIYEIENDNIRIVNFNCNKPVTTRFLNSCTDSIWSVGDNHIFSSIDGINWVEISNP